MPIITLGSVKNVTLGKGNFKEITGVKIGETEEWKTRIFASDKVLADQLHDFEPGDYINVVMEKKGQYWNAKEFKDVSDEDIEKALKFAKGGGKPTTSTGESFRRADGSSRGDDTNRSASIYLARDIINNVLTSQGGFGTMSCAEVACMAVELADKYINPYIKDGATSSVSSVVDKKPKGRPRKESADPLSPPVVEE